MSSPEPLPAPTPSSRTGSRLLPVVLLVALAGAAGGWWWWHARGAAAGAASGAAGTGDPAAGGRRQRGGGGPTLVTATTAKARDLRIERNALGTVTSLSTVTIRTQLAGRLMNVQFSEGQLVAPGDLLAQIDDRPYALSLAQYQGQLARDAAQLKQAEQDLASYQALVAQNSLTRQQLDTQAALVGQLRGTVASDQAQIDGVRLDLAYCRITAPAAGRIGLRQVDPGNYVTPGDANGLATITQFSPISVVFALPESDLPLLLPEVRAGNRLEARILDRDGVRELASGTLSTVDNAIDSTTGTLRMRATVANDDQLLYPNQFVNVRLLVQTRHVAAAVPIGAVQRNASGTYVWLVTDNVAHLRPVKTGVEAHNQVEVLDGLAAGDQVVTDGVDRLRDGAPVALAGAEQAAGGGDAAGGKAHGWKRQGDGAAPADGKAPGEGTAPAAGTAPAEGTPAADGQAPADGKPRHGAWRHKADGAAPADAPAGAQPEAANAGAAPAAPAAPATGR